MTSATPPWAVRSAPIRDGRRHRQQGNAQGIAVRAACGATPGEPRRIEATDGPARLAGMNPGRFAIRPSPAGADINTMGGMLYLRDLPKYECIRQQAQRYPQIDPRAVESFLVMLRVASDVLAEFEAYLAHHGMSQGKFTVLMVLNRNPQAGLSPSELADRCGVTRATMTGLLDGLEREKLVRREGDAADRRKAVVRLTTKTTRLLEQMLPGYYERIAHVMGGLPEAEKVHLIELLTKVNQRLPESASRRTVDVVEPAPGEAVRAPEAQLG